MATKLGIWNEALAELPSAPVTTEDEESLERRECERFYDGCIAELLEIQDWGFNTGIEALAETTNTRGGIWLYAYALPADMATPRRILPGWLFEDDATADIAGLYEHLPPSLYLIEDGILYTNEEDARLEYGRNAIAEVEMPALFRRALALELASRLAMPIKKDRELKADLIRQAEVAKDRAKADDENRHPRRFPTFVSEVGLARAGHDLGRL